MPGGVLAARHTTKLYGETVVLDGFTLVVSPGERIGLIGPNGIGKSTLLRLLAGVEEPDAGTVVREPSGLQVGYLPQVRRGEERHDDGTSSMPRPASSAASPGQAARAALEALAAQEADVLLLDEPTNDLDLDGLRLLDSLVRSFRGGLVAASHDRAFLEGMSAIVEFEPDTRRARTYAGGWSEYERERRAAQERSEQRWRRHVDERGHVEADARRMQSWHQRGYGQGRKKKKGRDLHKAIEQRRARLGDVEKPWSSWQLELRLDGGPRGSDAVAGLERAVIEVGGFSLGPLDLDISNGERLAVLGANGSGKSTLLRALLGEIEPVSGRRWVGPGTVLGTLPQGPGPFAGEEPLLGSFVERSGCSVQESRALLAKFSLSAEDVERPGRSLSPGERGRGALALLSAAGANTLVLDEPTNNLDLEAIEQLEQALAGFAGTIVLVTHDRRFLEAFAATRVLEL